LIVSFFNPYVPSTCRIVLQVSSGVEITLNNDAEAEANTVLVPMCKSLVFSTELSSVNVPVLAKVSPKRD